MDFRSRLIRTLYAVRPVLDEPGVLVIGSEVPNLLQRSGPALVVSQDVDIGVPVTRHREVKRRLREVAELKPSDEERSVWIPKNPDLIEVNFLGMDSSIRDASETYVLDDSELPLLVFGQLSLLRAAEPIEIEGGLRVPVPRTAGLLLEKLITERSGHKGDRDLLVVVGLLLTCSPEDVAELVSDYGTLPAELCYAVRSNLTMVSLMQAMEGMPDPQLVRRDLADLLGRLELADRGIQQ